MTFADGQVLEIRAHHVLSGAMLASSVTRAKLSAAGRHLGGTPGLELDDLLAAFDEALCAEASKISAPQVARQTLSIPRAEEIVRVEIPPERQKGRRYLRAA